MQGHVKVHSVLVMQFPFKEIMNTCTYMLWFEQFLFYNLTDCPKHPLKFTSEHLIFTVLLGNWGRGEGACPPLRTLESLP